VNHVYCGAEGKINLLKATPPIVGAARQAGARFLPATR
jgi:hypothetical protein